MQVELILDSGGNTTSGIWVLRKEVVLEHL